jgi:hypothetical protein
MRSGMAPPGLGLVMPATGMIHTVVDGTSVYEHGCYTE